LCAQRRDASPCLLSLSAPPLPGLTKTSPLKAGTALKLPLPIDVSYTPEPPPPEDPAGVGVVLVHYVGGEPDQVSGFTRTPTPSLPFPLPFALLYPNLSRGITPPAPPLPPPAPTPAAPGAPRAALLAPDAFSKRVRTL
jgi:hypothetical protein